MTSAGWRGQFEFAHKWKERQKALHKWGKKPSADDKVARFVLSCCLPSALCGARS